MKKIQKIKGLTLIEVVLSMTIVGICLTSVVLGSYYQVAKAPSSSVIQQANIIAQGYLAEILTKSFPTTLPCPAPPASRSNYTNVCNYNNLTNIGAYDAKGNLLPGTDNFKITVALVTSNVAKLNAYTGGNTAAQANVVRIDVTVVYTMQGTVVPFSKVVMSAYKGKHL